MTDPVQTPEATEKKTRQMSFTVLDSGEIRADFGEGVEPLTLNPAMVPESLQALAIVEGFISRLRGATSKLQGEDRTPDNLRSAVDKGMQSLLSGVWKIERASSGVTEFPIEVEAAWVFKRLKAESKGETFTVTLEEAAAAWATLTEDQKTQLKALPRYQLARAQVKAQRDAAKLAKLQKSVDAGEGEEWLF